MAIHWWDTEALITQLAEDRLPESDAVGYAMITCVLYALAVYAPNWFGSYTQLLIQFFVVALIMLAGVRACFKANGGPGGEDFLKRITVISAPVAIKFMIASIVLGQLAYFGLTYVSGIATLDDSDSAVLYQIYAFGFTTAFYAVYYWRIAGHLSRVVKLRHPRPVAEGTLRSRAAPLAQVGDGGISEPISPYRRCGGHPTSSTPQVMRVLAMMGNLLLVLMPIFYLFSSSKPDLAYFVVSGFLVTLATISAAALASKFAENSALFMTAVLINAVTIILFIFFSSASPNGSVVILAPALMNFVALAIKRRSWQPD